MTIFRNALRFIAACFLVAAFVYMFATLEAHFAQSAYMTGYTDCLFQVPGVQPESSIATSFHTGHTG